MTDPAAQIAYGEPAAASGLLKAAAHGMGFTVTVAAVCTMPVIAVLAWLIADQRLVGSALAASPERNPVEVWLELRTSEQHTEQTAGVIAGSRAGSGAG